MIYVLAAYSITIGMLALYCVLLQHRGRVYAGDEMTARESVDGSWRAGFNLGAALLAPIWMWRHGLRLAGAGLLSIEVALVALYDREMWIPLIFVAIVPLAAGAALGFVGNRIATNHLRVETVAELSASQLVWAIAGIGVFTVVLPWLWFVLRATA